MMDFKTAELSGAALDWAVAEALGLEFRDNTTVVYHSCLHAIGGSPGHFMQWHPSTNWAQGGPLIERFKVGISAGMNGRWCAVKGTPYYAREPLVAAMRAIVASNLGKEVDVPEELL